MTPRYLALFVLLISVFTTGCGAKASPLVGKYKGVFKSEANSPFKDMGEASYINLKDGGRFTMMLVAEQSGSWTEEGGIVKVTPESMGSLDIPESSRKTMQLKVSEDGKTLTPTEGGTGEDAGLVFTKE